MSDNIRDIDIVAPNTKKQKVLKSFFPIGTPAELAEYGFDPEEWGSCAPPTRGGGAGPVGCYRFHECALRKQFESAPMRARIEHFKNEAKGNTMRLVDVDCWTLVDKRLKADGEGDVVNVVAVEASAANKARGLPTSGLMPISVQVPGLLGTVRYETRMQETEVAPFPRISDNPALLKEATTNRALLDNANRKRVAQRDKTMNAAGLGISVTTDDDSEVIDLGSSDPADGRPKRD